MGWVLVKRKGVWAASACVHSRQDLYYENSSAVTDNYKFCVSFVNFQLGLTKSRVYMVNGIILILLFFVMRILNYPIAVLVYAAQYHNWSIWSALKNLYPLCHTLSAIQFAFQAFWFYQIFRLGAKAILSKKEA